MSEFHSHIDAATGVAIVSEVEPGEIDGQLVARTPAYVQRALASWAEEAQDVKSQGGQLFERNRYVTPTRVFEQMGLAYDALDDDIVSNVLDTSEAIAFQKVEFECPDYEQEQMWGKVGKRLDFDTFVRQAWRELFLVSQFYVVMWWGNESIKLTGKAEKRKRRKSFDLYMPTGIGFLDPTRIVPVKNGIFGDYRLAWIASDQDMSLLDAVGTTGEDQVVSQLFVEKFVPGEKEKRDLSKEGIDPDRLIMLNPDMVWRHSLTKGTYERWARIRMKSVFPLLDLKAQLRSMDRSYLRAGMNFIVLVTRGTDQLPASRTEVENATYMMRTQSRSPVIVTDHRIRIEIITPDMTNVMDDRKWMVLDERLLMRLWGMFQLPSGTSNRETSVTLGKVIARSISNRRHMLKRAIERHVIDAIVDHPLNAELDLESAKLEFAPRRMELEYDPAMVSMVQELRDRGDLSRETVLNEFNFDQELEAQRRKIEEEKYDDTFKPVNVPFDSPNRGTTPGGSGRQGGRPAGQPQNQQDQQDQQDQNGSE